MKSLEINPPRRPTMVVLIFYGLFRFVSLVPHIVSHVERNQRLKELAVGCQAY